MSAVSETSDNSPAVQGRNAEFERRLLKMPQAECPLSHHFGPGVYVREVTIPAGAMAIGHHQKLPHLNILIKGAVLMLGEDGEQREVRAPLIFEGKPGRKVGVALEDTVWLNVYAAEERDIEVLEARFIEKSQQWLAADKLRQRIAFTYRQRDRDDFADLLEESGFSAEVARQQSERTSDQIGAPESHGNVRIRPSSIEGSGVFLNAPVEPFHVIAPAVIDGKRTPVGRYANHSATPNACMVRRLDGGIDLVALERIRGCLGGQEGDEVTIDYRQAMRLSDGMKQGDSA